VDGRTGFGVCVMGGLGGGVAWKARGIGMGRGSRWIIED
jgi:hypothetical protein